MRRSFLAVVTYACLGASAPFAQVSGNSVKVGVLTDFTGVFSGLAGPGGVVAARMAISDFGGKVAGVPIELISADHGNKADIGSGLARRWYDENGVDLVLDVPNSSVALAVQAIARERNKLVIYSGAGTADLTGKGCMPTSFQWTWDTYSVAVSTGRAVLEEGRKNWYVIAADYAFGQTMSQDVSRVVTAQGGKVLGIVKHPVNTADFSSFILQAQAASPDVIALANGGTDTINSVKQFGEFAGDGSPSKLVGLAVFLTDVHGIGVKSAAGLLLTTGFYWDRNDETRAWAKRFFDQHGAMPTMAQAGNYSAVMHYLKAVEALGSDDPVRVAAKMRELPVEDIFTDGGHIREDGRMVHEMYLAQVKKPQEVRYPWDYYNILRVIPKNETVRPASESECSLLRK